MRLPQVNLRTLLVIMTIIIIITDISQCVNAQYVGHLSSQRTLFKEQLSSDIFDIAECGG